MRDRERHPLLQERGDLLRDIVVARLLLHRPRLALHVHEAEIRAGGGHDVSDLGIVAERRHVVDEDCAALECRTRHRSLRSVDRERHLAAEPIEHGHHALQFVLHGHACGTGARRLPADVDDRSSVLDHTARRRGRNVRIEMDSAVGERVGRDVHDTHHGRA